MKSSSSSHCATKSKCVKKIMDKHNNNNNNEKKKKQEKKKAHENMFENNVESKKNYGSSYSCSSYSSCNSHTSMPKQTISSLLSTASSKSKTSANNSENKMNCNDCKPSTALATELFVEASTSTSTSTSTSNSPPKTLGIFEIKLIRAKNLLNKDILGRTDPFAIIKFQNQKRVSKAIRNNLNPEWNQKFTFNVYHSGDFVTVSLWDKELIFKKFLGIIKIDFASLFDGIPVEKWHKLQRRSYKSHVRGKILLQFQFIKFDQREIIVDKKSKVREQVPKNMNSENEPSDEMYHDSCGNEWLVLKNPGFSKEKKKITDQSENDRTLLTRNTSQVSEEDCNERLCQEYMNKLSTCLVCETSKQYENMLLLDCSHIICDNCLSEHVHKSIKNYFNIISCPIVGCSSYIAEWALRQTLPPDEFEIYQHQVLELYIESNENCFRCPNPECSVIIEKAGGEDSAVDCKKLIGIDGFPVSLKAFENFKANRFRCRTCSSEFCGQCKSIPYHTGFTCESYQDYLKSKHCRFCGRQLTSKNMLKKSDQKMQVRDICCSEECVQKEEICCGRNLPCGHSCFGIRLEKHYKKCLRCLDPSCSSSSSSQNSSDFCNICWVESLGRAPCIELECGHIFHYSCVKNKILKMWTGARVTFGFMNCPLCGKEISHPSLETDIHELKILKNTIKSKAMMRLQFEGLAKVPDIINPKGKYYNNPEGYSMGRYAYYMCYKCKKPYFGGLQRCEAGGPLEDAGEFDPSELVCGPCSGGSSTVLCPKHGKEFIEYKCQFCCSVATWFCWGRTRFCDQCHKKQIAGNYLNRKPKSYFPRCPGPSKCPLKVKHPHVEEFSLGCSICRNMQTF